MAQNQIAALMQIEQAAWRADDHVDAALEELNLLLIGAPAVDGSEADRQVRGRIVQALRESPDPVTRAALASTWPDDATKVDRCLAALVEDGLVEPTDDGAAYRLPR